MATSNMGIRKVAQLIVVCEQVGRYMLCAALALILASSVFAAPTVTVTASAQSILGTTQTVSMTVTLIDPNTTGMLKAGAVVVTNFTATSSSATTVSVGPIFGNDVIADGFGNLNQTYYKVQVFPVSNGVIASTPALQNFYAFIGSGTIDVSSATPLSPSFQTGTSGNVVLPGTLSVSGLITASSGVAGIGPKFQQFTSSGTFTIPAGVTSVKVTVVGAGGGGGGSDAGATFNGSGGGSGGCGIKWLSGLTPANTLTVTVGTGGIVTSGAAGGNGVASSVASGTQVITTITANGGSGGSSASGVLIGGNGAAAGTGGDLNLAGITAVNAAPIATMSNWGGQGAPSILGGGGSSPFAGAGTPGNAFGSGGSGAGGGAARAGGVGANGIVIFEYVQ